MIGAGVLGVNHELKPDEIIFEEISDENVLQTRERVSDIFTSYGFNLILFLNKIYFQCKLPFVMV